MLAVLGLTMLLGCLGQDGGEPNMDVTIDYTEIMNSEELGVATFAGGCFWCIEAAFESTDGVKEAVSGYTGGKMKNPTYRHVSTGTTGHYEAVQVYYDPIKLSYEKLLEVFFFSIDPTDEGGQFADRGSQYRTAIFYHDEEQKKAAEKYITDLEASKKFDKSIAVKTLPAMDFYQAEDHHQDYHIKAATRYKAYSTASGRKSYTQKTWGN